MKKGTLALALVCTLFIYACSTDGYTKLESGYAYKLIENVEGRKAVPGDFMMIDLKSVLGDSVIAQRTAESGFGLDPLRGTPEKMREVLAFCNQGDSVHVKMSLMEYALLTRMAVPQNMDTTQSVVMQMRIVEVDNQASILARRKTAQMARDKQVMDDYLAAKGLEAELSPNGIYNIVREEGTGPYPARGQRVAVNYVLRLTDGTFVDTSYEEVAREEGNFDERRLPYHPYAFTVGNDRVISGWHLGIPLVKVGGKSTLLIPSSLGYGADVDPNGPIPPHAVLVYDVEVVEILD